MATLEWDFRVTNANVVERALAGIERRVIVHNQRVARSLGQTTKTPSSRTLQAARGVGPEVAAAEKVAQAKMRAEAKVDAYIRKAEFKRARDLEKAAERAAAKAERDAIRAAKRIAAAEERERKKAEKAAKASQIRTGRAIGNSVTGAIGGVGRLAGAALGIGGGFAVAGAIENQMSEEAKASQLANQAGTPSDKKQILTDARSVKGFTGAEALSGMEAIVTKTGDLKLARTIIGDLGTLALATGSDLGDLGATAGQVFNVLKDQIQDPKEQLSELKSIMGTLAQQGAMGAVEIRDLAVNFGKLGAATRGFEGGSSNLLKTMGAFAQVAVARGGASSSEEAATASARLAGDIVTNKKKFQALGIDIKSKTDKTKLRDPVEIIAEVLGKTGGDIEKTSGLFGMESKKIFAGLSPVFAEAEKRKKGSGVDAVKAEVAKYASAFSSDDSLNTRANSRLDDSDLQFKEAMKQFNAEVGSKLLPAITKLIPKIAELAPTMGRLAEKAVAFAEFFEKNPLAGIGAIMAAQVTADMARAGLGNLVAGQMTQIVGAFSTSLAAGGAALATFALAAGAAVAAISWAVSEYRDLMQSNKNLGWDDIGAAFTGSSKGTYGLQGMFDSLDAKNNAEAKADFQKRQSSQQSSTQTTASVTAAPASNAAAQLDALGRSAAKANAELMKLQGVMPNRGNSPSPIKG